MDIIINSYTENAPKSSTNILSQNDFMLNVLVQLGQDPLCTPVADLLKSYYELEGEWLIASPIHWEATHNDAMIVAFSDTLNLNEPTAKVWFTAVSQFLAQDNFQLIYHNPTYWMIQTTNKPCLRSNNLNTLHYKSMRPALANLGDTLYWQHLLTELQMFLSNHPLNNYRESSYPINGIWFWGGGQVNYERLTSRPIISNATVINNFLRMQPKAIDPDTNFGKDHILALDHCDAETLAILNKNTKQYQVNWYWNNIAYQTQRKNWWGQLFGSDR